MESNIVSRGIRNNNPFNIKKSSNSWQGKVYKPSSKYGLDPVFEVFKELDFGLRAGFCLLRNAYLFKGYDTPRKIISRFAPSSENNVERYLAFVCEDCPITPDEKISVNSLSFYHLCRKMLLFESGYELSYQHYIDVIKKFRLWNL